MLFFLMQTIRFLAILLVSAAILLGRLFMVSLSHPKHFVCKVRLLSNSPTFFVQHVVNFSLIKQEQRSRGGK